MEIEKALEILKSEGYRKEFLYNESEIKEKPSYPEDSYYFLLKERDNWRFGYINMERGKNEEKIIGTYGSLKDGMNYFLLDRLKKHYLHKYISRAKNDTRIIELLIKKELMLDDLINALRQCKIPESYLSIQEINNHTIRILEVDGIWKSEYIDINGNNHKRTRPESLQECISYAFAKIMYLYLLDNVTMKYLDGIKSYEYFTPDEIATYVG